MLTGVGVRPGRVVEGLLPGCVWLGKHGRTGDALQSNSSLLTLLVLICSSSDSGVREELLKVSIIPAPVGISHLGETERSGRCCRE